MILVLDYGSQYTQLIAKKLRRLGFSTEVWSGKTSAAKISAERQAKNIAGVVLSGSPASVGGVVDPDPKLFDLDLPVLGLCFGYQFMAAHFGGKVSSQADREYGAARVVKTTAGKEDLLTQKLSGDCSVWMSHGDSVVEIPPGAELLLESGQKPAAFKIKNKKFWGLQFHPEVHHTPEGATLLEAFATEICGLKPDWNLASVLEKLRADLEKRLARVDEVYCAVSGGVDSTVLAVLLSETTQVRALFVDHGFQRAYEVDDLKKTFAPFKNIHLEVIDASETFWRELENVSDPEKKRQIAGRLFIETFYAHMPQAAGPEKIHLAQGTIYSDVIESAANELAPAHKIKSHHNVGGLPEVHNFDLVEPLRNFFKDEVREIGAMLKINPESLSRHPFPGPGLLIRCVGALTRERINILRACDKIMHDELKARGLYQKTWQAACIILPVSSVGVMGDERSYESVIALRAVSSLDAMTAEASEFPWADLKAIGSKIINQVRGVNRVVYDLTSKPPGTIEWE